MQQAGKWAQILARCASFVMYYTYEQSSASVVMYEVALAITWTRVLVLAVAGVRCTAVLTKAVLFVCLFTGPVPATLSQAAS